MNPVLKAFLLLVPLDGDLCRGGVHVDQLAGHQRARRTRTCRNGCGADHAAAGHSPQGPQSPEPRHGDA